MESISHRGTYFSQVFGNCNSMDPSTNFGPTHCSTEGNDKPVLHFFFIFIFVFYAENSIIRQSKMKCEIVGKDETPRSKSTQMVTGIAENMYRQICCYNTTRPKSERCLATDVHKGERQVRCCTTHKIETWNLRSINQGKLEIVKQEMDCLNIAVLVVNKLK